MKPKGIPAIAPSIEALMLPALDALPNASFMVFDTDLRYVVARGRAVRRHGFLPEKLEGRLAKEALTPDRWAFYEPMYRGALNGETQSIEVMSPDDQRRYLVEVGPLRAPDGAIAGGISIAVDITDLRRAEEASARVAAIVESSDDAMTSGTLEGILTSWNAGAERMFGYRADEMIGNPATVLIPPDRRDEVPALLARLASGERVDHFETRRRRKDGVEIDVSLSVSPMLDAEGRPVAYATVARDIGVQKRAERTLRESEERSKRAYEVEHRAAERLRELDLLKNEFVGIVSHDLRSPLAAISGFASILLDQSRPVDDEERRRLIAIIARNATEMELLIEDILDVSLIESGALSLEIEPFDLADMVRRVASEMAVVAGRPYAVSVPDGCPPAMGDVRRQQQIVRNLISNAFKFSAPGTAVEVSVRAHEATLEVDVRDHGVGIAEEDLPKLFQKFSRIQQRGREPSSGTGLGLYICKSCVERHGGSIRVESRVGAGSTFTYSVPIAGDAPPVG